MRRKLTYKSGGVDIDKANLFKERLNLVLSGKIGGFGGLFKFDNSKYKNPILVASCDGVGTKLLIAQAMNKHDTVGIDLVAMNVNDILCMGAVPLFFLDYIACGKLEPEVLLEVVKGINKGCVQAGCCLIGGETAQMPGMYKKDEYDLAGFVVGVVEKDKVIDGSKIKAGDVVVGLESNGLHSNGFSLVRKLFSPSELKKYTNELLRPTRIYVRPVLSLLQSAICLSADKAGNLQSSIKGIAHITGGAFYDKIARILPNNVNVRINKNSWLVPRIFKLIQKKGNITGKEMFHTFNMGVGMVLVVDKNYAKFIIRRLAKNKLKSWVIGRIIKGTKRVLIMSGRPVGSPLRDLNNDAGAHSRAPLHRDNEKDAMRILVIGSGGREHALVWKIAQSKSLSEIFCAPGNGGVSEIAQCLDIKAEDIEGLLNFAKKKKIDLTVVGPEAPLASGIVDEFIKHGLKIFGPCKKAAQLEASKVFAKELMQKYNVPTANFKIFDNPEKAKKYIAEKGVPLVVKADGLAQGKGVMVAKTTAEAMEATECIMEQKKFGDSGKRIIIEDCLEGDEASIIVITDSKTIMPLVSSQDHKRIFDGDKGANTGGMGAYSPAPVVGEELFKEILDKIIYRVIEGLKKEGIEYRGVLYVGIMLTKDGPKVLEFNVRFGDPETQAILPRLNSDLIDVIEAAIEGRLKDIKLNWDNRACVSVVIASGGYPGKYEKGKEIYGLDELKKIKDVIVFHAGTIKQNNKYLTNGGRVLNVSALADTIKQAQTKVYEAIKLINFEGMFYRNDIGWRAI